MVDTTPPLLSPLLPWEEEKVSEEEEEEGANLSVDPLDPDTRVRIVSTTIYALRDEGAWQDVGCNATDNLDGDVSDKVCLSVPAYCFPARGPRY